MTAPVLAALDPVGAVAVAHAIAAAFGTGGLVGAVAVALLSRAARVTWRTVVTHPAAARHVCALAGSGACIAGLLGAGAPALVAVGLWLAAAWAAGARRG
jgi:hypothetical protein